MTVQNMSEGISINGAYKVKLLLKNVQYETYIKINNITPANSNIKKYVP